MSTFGFPILLLLTSYYRINSYTQGFKLNIVNIIKISN